jgi:amino acid efflux transporter
MLALSLRGLRASTAVQLALVAVLLLVIVVAIVGALPRAAAANFTPFAPHGWSAIGRAASVLMLSFVGWEAVAPLTGRFADPRRQLPRAIGAAFAITATIYLALALITIAALGARAGTEVPMAALLTLAIGGAGQTVAAIAALLLTLGAVNAYLAGGSALSRTLSGRPRARWFPVSLVVAGVVILGLIGTGVISVAAAIAVPAAFFLVVYLGCMLSAARSMPGRTRVLAVIAAAAILVILGYAGPAAIPALLVAVGAAIRAPFSRDAGNRLGTGSPSKSRPGPPPPLTAA